MADRVNLDALIIREDFEVLGGDSSKSRRLGNTFKVSELTPESTTYLILRKPDFQRETNAWTPEKVANFIQSFLEGDLIPTVILWRSDKNGNVFVIDGAHRLSALIAWAHDDYGDKTLSRKFFDNNIPASQQAAADATRKLIEAGPGSYAQLSLALAHPNLISEERIRFAKDLAMIGIELQWVEGDAKKAEKSFFVINQQGEPINETELRMIENRQKPYALAARALIRAGTGHKYWSLFSLEIQKKIEDIAREIHDILFLPDYVAPIKTLDLPVAGKGYSAESVKLVFDFVIFANRHKIKSVEPSSHKLKVNKNEIAESNENEISDTTGQSTVDYLKSVKRLISLVTGKEPESLGLHPAVYYYTATGRYQRTCFLAAVTFAERLQAEKKLIEFTDIRERFEEILVKYKYFTNQIVRSRGSDERGLDPMIDLYNGIYEGCVSGFNENDIIDMLPKRDKLKSIIHVINEGPNNSKGDFSRNTKSAVALRQLLDTAARCNECNARLHVNSISIDHVVNKVDGGSAHSDNGKMVHPYCNTGYKEYKRSKS